MADSDEWSDTLSYIELKDTNCYLCKTLFNSDVHNPKYCPLTNLAFIRNVMTTYPLITPKFTFKFSFYKNTQRHNQLGETDLHIESKKGRKGEVQRLLCLGVNVNIQDNAGWSPLHEAVIANHLSIVELLLEHGADANIVGSNYFTPLHSALHHKIDPCIVKRLVEYGANLLARNIFGQTSLDITPQNLLKIICTTYRLPHITQNFTVPQLKIHCDSLNEFHTSPLFQDHNILWYSEEKFYTGGDTTHLIVDPNHLDRKKIQAAIVQGAFITDSKKMQDFMKANHLSFDPFQYVLDIEGFAHHKALINKLMGKPKLFDGISFHLCRDDFDRLKNSVNDCVYSKEDLIMFISLGGGKILVRPPSKPSDEYRYPYHTNQSGNISKVTCYQLCNNARHSNLKFTQTTIMHKSISWFLNCVNNFEIK